MSLVRIRIDESTWAAAGDRRRREWTLIIEEVLLASDFQARADAHTLTVGLNEQGVILDLLDEAGTSLAAARVSRDSLTRHVQEYVDVVRQLERAQDFGGRSRIEALDMGKKVVHDAAATTVQTQVRELGLDHRSCRRLWTLIFALRIDTTKLASARVHRPSR